MGRSTELSRIQNQNSKKVADFAGNLGGRIISFANPDFADSKLCTVALGGLLLYDSNWLFILMLLFFCFRDVMLLMVCNCIV